MHLGSTRGIPSLRQPQRNVDIERTGLPERLRTLRQERNLTQSDLAARAGLTYRTILEIEKGRRRRVQSKTLMLLAGALDLSFAELMEGGNGAGGEPGHGFPPDDSGRSAMISRRRILVALVLVAFIVGGASVWKWSIDTAGFEVEGSTLTVYDGVLGLELWSYDAGAEISFCRRSPWARDMLLVGTRDGAADAGCLTAVDAADGETIWTVSPDPAPFLLAFGPDPFTALQFNCERFLPVDADGDGELELAVYFHHIRWDPACLCRVDRDGRLLNQYVHKGFFYALEAVDLDRDGRQELLAGGINGCPGIEGGTIVLLDADHWHGASVGTHCRAESDIVDGSLRRFLLPHFPDCFRGQWTSRYLAIVDLMVSPAIETGVVISAEAEIDDCHVLFDIDGRFRPRSVAISEGFRRVIASWPDSLRTGPNPGDPAWLSEWFEQAIILEPETIRGG